MRRSAATSRHSGTSASAELATKRATSIGHSQSVGIDRTWRAVLVGVGNLARALLRYQGFRAQGFEIVGLFDSDPAKVGQTVEGLSIEPVIQLPERLPTLKAELGVVTVPGEVAQGVADELSTAGVRGILNFAPVVLRLPAHVRLVTVDLTIQLEQLAFLIQHADASSRPVDSADDE